MQINSEAIVYNDRIYPIKNISSAGLIERRQDYYMASSEYKKRRKRHNRLALMLLVLPVLYLVLINGPHVLGIPEFYWIALFPGFEGYYSESYSLIAWGMRAIAIIVWLRGRKRPIEQVTEYGLELQTNSGSVSLLWSIDKEFMSKLKDVVFKALSSTGTAINYSVNIDNRQFQDNSHNVLNSTTNITHDYSINFAEHKGLTSEQIIFLTNDFNKALQELARISTEKNNEDVVAELKELRDAISKPDPDPNLVKKTYGRLKGVCDVYDTSDKVMSLFKVIGAGVAYFLT
ncbi:DUF6232 family protein [Paracoccus sp. SSK6]|uniref:DUF6232 family protein n=1 Tax=Paracoccus sp. SSK6 TaxID=3143131 RepID=UPI00321A9142